MHRHHELLDYYYVAPRQLFVGFTQNLMICNDVCVYTIVPLIISIGLWKTTIGNDQNVMCSTGVIADVMVLGLVVVLP